MPADKIGAADRKGTGVRMDGRECPLSRAGEGGIEKEDGREPAYASMAEVCQSKGRELSRP